MTPEDRSAELQWLNDHEPIVTIQAATHNIKGLSKCSRCGNGGTHSYFTGKDWTHSPSCPWMAARRKVGSNG